MQKLIILANPVTKSFSHKIAAAYHEGAESAHHKIELLDLYTTDLQLPFLEPETPEEHEEFQPTREALQEKIYAADEIAIIHPLWWGGPPAILKNFIDQVFTPGFAYQQKPRRALKNIDITRPVGLLKGRKVRVFITTDRRRWRNILPAFPYLAFWYFYTIRFSGMRLVSYHLMDARETQNDLIRAKWIAKINRLGAL